MRRNAGKSHHLCGMVQLATAKEEQIHWLALRLAPGLGARLAVRLVERYRTPEAVFRATPSELRAEGLNDAVARSISSGCTFDEAVEQHEKALAAGAELVSVTDPRYPKLLKLIADPPLLLFCLGRLELLQSVMLGVVGTRRPSQYGLAAAERLSGDLARAGLTVTSGMARGIDTAAHRGALAVDGNTAAVFGCGVDVVYPAENKKLHDEICQRGLGLTEYPMGAPGFPQNFPVRNRIISGLSVGVLVVEGAQYSGSAITARIATEQGREVFAVPGNITSKMSWGPNLLIKEGAKLVQEATDVLEELDSGDRRRLNCGAQPDLLPPGDQARLPLSPSSALQQSILDILQPDTATHVDDLIGSLEHYSSSEIVAALFELELLGLIKQIPGRNFLKVW